jgi:CSLREA domain-containing protein
MTGTSAEAVRRLRGAAVVVAGVLCFVGSSAQAAHAEVFVVNSTADVPVAKLGEHVCVSAADTCTLRAAIQEAGIDGGTNTIMVPPGYYRLTIPPSPEAGFAGPNDASSGQLAIPDGTLTIIGAGARQTIVDGNHLDRVFSIGIPATASITGMTITGGDSTGGNTSKEIDMGGGVYNTGTLTLDRVAVVGNHADGGGGLFSVPGSYITISDSLIAHNTAYEAGGIRFDGGGELLNSTVTDNRLLPLPNQSYLQDPKLASALADELTGYGGGIDFRGGNNLDIINSTITDNHAIKGGGGLNSAQSYAAVSPDTSIGITLLLNTIIAENTSTRGGDDCNVEDNVIRSEGHNLDGDGSCFLTSTGDLPKHDPLVGPLAFNGGPTETQALLSGSPAIGAGATQGCPPYDQRGVPRPHDTCDIGAYQYAPRAPRGAQVRTRPKRRAQAVRRRRGGRMQHGRHHDASRGKVTGGTNAHRRVRCDRFRPVRRRSGRRRICP